MLSLGEYWSKKYHVDVFWKDKNILKESEKRLNLNLDGVGVVSNVFAEKNIFQKIALSRLYDLIFFLSDGSVPTTFAKYNILHFQVPFPHISMPPWKARRYQRIVCNSEFTRTHLDPHVPLPVSVIYPPVDTGKIHAGRKIRTILSVGRFSGQYNAKKFDVLISAFRQAYRYKQLSGWKLIIAGGLLRSDNNYFNQLKFKAKGLPVELYPNCSFVKLKSLYERATVYWHAAGFGETNPRYMEHFGITTVESMAAGCIPVVFAAGGQSEIVEDAKNGYLWHTTDELIRRTVWLIQNKDSLTTMRKAAMKKAQEFSTERFCLSFDRLLDGITDKK